MVAHTLQHAQLIATVGQGLHGLPLPGINPVVHPDLLHADHWISEKTHRCRRAGDQRRRHQPAPRPPIAHDCLHPGLDPHLAEGQWTGSHGPAADAAAEQGGGISAAVLLLQRPDHLLVAGPLDIPAQQGIGRPQQRVEPVDGEEQEAQRLPPVVAPADVSPLMGDHIGQIPFLQPVGQVDHRPQEPQDKGRIHPLALPDIFPEKGGSAHPAPQAQIADQGVEQQQDHPCQPEPGQDKGPDLGGVGTGRRRRGQGLRQNGVDGAVEGGDTAADLGLSGVEDLRRQGLGAGQEAQGALDGDRTEQPEGHQSPEEAEAPPGRPPEDRPQRQHHQHQPAGGEALVDQLEKDRFHGLHLTFR